MFEKSEGPELDLSAVASVTQHTHVREEENNTAKVKIDLEFLGFLETRQLSCQYRVHFARLRETRVTFVIPMLNHFDRNVWRWPDCLRNKN